MSKFTKLVKAGLIAFAVALVGHTTPLMAADEKLQTLFTNVNVFDGTSDQRIGSINRLFWQSGRYQEAQTHDRFAPNPRQTSPDIALQVPEPHPDLSI